MYNVDVQEDKEPQLFGNIELTRPSHKYRLTNEQITRDTKVRLQLIQKQ